MRLLSILSLFLVIFLPSFSKAQDSHNVFYDVRSFGAKGDGLASSGVNNSNAFISALNVCSSQGGGTVYVPPTGAAYHLATSVSTSGNGCGLVGQSIDNWPGKSYDEARWTSQGSWISCDMTGSSGCLDFSGSGFVEKINIWHKQPTPSNDSTINWKPNVYPYAIVLRQNFSHVKEIFLANSYNGIWFAGNINSSIYGTYSYAYNVHGEAFNNLIKLSSVNDTMNLFNIHARPMWGLDNNNIIRYKEENSSAFIFNYVDNLISEVIECYKVKNCFFFADGKSKYGDNILTHAMQNGIFSDITFNQVVYATLLENNSTTVSLIMNNVNGQTDTDTNQAGTAMFNFASDNADIQLNHIRISSTGNALFSIGAGKSGYALLTDIVTGCPLNTADNNATCGVGYFSTPHKSSSAALYLAKGSILSIPTGTQDLIMAPSNLGKAIDCVGAYNCGLVRSPMIAPSP